jgi:hypothetical protein
MNLELLYSSQLTTKLHLIRTSYRIFLLVFCPGFFCEHFKRVCAINLCLEIFGYVESKLLEGTGGCIYISGAELLLTCYLECSFQSAR